MKTITSMILFILAFTCLFSQVAVAPAEGTGTVDNPFQIATLENLYWIAASNDVVSNPAQATRWQSHYLQTANIDASATVNWFEGQGWSVIGNHWDASSTFRGSYNGQGFYIHGLYINRPGTTAVGLFGYTNSMFVQNVGIINANITGHNLVGALVGRNDYTSSIINCYSTGIVNGNDNIGGLAGWNRHSSSIQNSYSTASVSGASIIGGLVGYNTHSAIIENCYSRGSVTGNSSVGGLVGSNRWGTSTILNSYSTGFVTGNTLTGGFAGQDDGSSVGIQNSCYWDISTSGYSTSAGQEQGRITAEMAYPYDPETYSAWDFLSVWREDETFFNAGYPFFQWQSVSGLGTIEGTVSLNGGDGNISDVIIDVGYFTINPEPNGFYSFELHAGIYSISTSLFGYQTVTITGIEVEQYQTTTGIDFILGNIEIAVSPDQVQLNIEHGEIVSVPLTITNNGNGDLAFSVEIDQHRGWRFGQESFIPFHEIIEHEFDNLAPVGSSVEKGVIARELSRFDNPFPRVPGWNHLFPGNWGASATDGIGIVNPGTWFAGIILDLNDDSGGEITKVAYYDYDAAGGITAQIYSGDLYQPLVLLSESSLYQATGSNSYVVLDLINPVLIEENTLYWIVIKVLDLGSGFFPLGTVNPHIANGGKIVIGNPLTSPWSDLPTYGFQSSWIIGAFVEAEPWLFVNPISGTVPAGGDLVIDIEIDAGVVWTGTYTADVIITNDSPSGPVSVPIAITVMLNNPYIISNTASVDLRLGINQQHTEPISISNIGGTMMLYDVTTDAEWLNLSPNSGLIMPEENQTIELQFDTNELVFGDYTTTIVFNHNGTNELTIPVHLSVTPVSFIQVFPTYSEVLILPDTTRTEIMTISNTGDGDLEFSFSVVQNDSEETDYSIYTLNPSELTFSRSDMRPSNDLSPQIIPDLSETRDPVEIHYDTGYDSGVGTGGPANFICAIRFTPEELGDYYDLYGIFGIKYHIRSNQFSSVSIKVWEGGSFGNPNNEIYSHNVTSQVQIEQWSVHYPEYPIPLVAGNEYWIGYAINATTGYPASIDSGPAVVGKGEWIFFNNEWLQLSQIGMSYNWCIRGLLDYMVDPWVITTPRSGVVPPGESIDIEITYNSNEIQPDTTLTADLVINNNSLQGSLIVSATMHVVSIILEPPFDLVVDEATALFSWSEPLYDERITARQDKKPLRNSSNTKHNRLELSSYHVYLDGHFQGNTRNTEYQLDTETLTPGVTYTAGVRAVYVQGLSIMRSVQFTYHPLEIEDAILFPTTLMGNYPNPFNPSTTISYSISTQDHVMIEIFDVKGRKIGSLVDEIQPPGAYTVVWNGLDVRGQKAGSGVYFYRMRSGEYTKSRKMLLLK